MNSVRHYSVGITRTYMYDIHVCAHAYARVIATAYVYDIQVLRYVRVIASAYAYYTCMRIQTCLKSEGVCAYCMFCFELNTKNSCLGSRNL